MQMALSFFGMGRIIDVITTILHVNREQSVLYVEVVSRYCYGASGDIQHVLSNSFTCCGCYISVSGDYAQHDTSLSPVTKFAHQHL